VVENFNDSQLNAIDTKIASSEDDDDLNYFKSLAE
jgi:hypothetical protein